MTDVVQRLSAALADRYAIERELGAGGMATVYLAEDLRHRRKVALKVLREDLAASLGTERFHREIQIAAQLQHPNILPLLDSGEAAGFLYYVMPYVEGQSVRERLAREGALPVGDAVRILRDVVDALTEAHVHGVVHRDIKPENIMLRGRHALVTDFGVAKAVSEATGRQMLTTAGVALGTPAYMAPEQASADPHLDHRVDIYAVGAVGYELLTGRPVFMGTTPQMVLAAHVTEAPVPVTRYRETVPRALEAVVMRCLEKRPADRWQSAAELLPQLEALTTPSGGITPTDTQPVPAVVRRRWLPGAIAVAALVVLAVAAVLWRTAGPRPRPELIRLQLTSSGIAYEPIMSPDGSQIAYELRRCTPLEGCATDLVVRDLATEAEQTIIQGARWINPLRYSPDGARILFWASLPAEGEGAFVVPRIGGAVTTLFAVSDSLYGVDFLPGGDSVLAHVGESLRSVLVASGQIVQTVPLPPTFITGLRGVSADGRWLAFERPQDYYQGTTLLITDRRGRVVDSLATPVLAGTARWQGSRTLLALEGQVRLGVQRALLRWDVSPRSGRVSLSDTVLLAATYDAADVSADGRSLILSNLSAGESELWTLEPGAGGVLRPMRKVLGSTGALSARIAADGRTIAYLVWSGGPRGRNVRVYVDDFAGGRARPLTPPIPEADYLDLTMSGYGERIYVATRSGQHSARVVSYEVATGRAQPFIDLPSPDVLVWARPGGGMLWHRSEGADTLHVLEASGRTVAAIPDPAPPGAGFLIPVLSPDANEVALRYYESAAGERTESGIVLYTLSLADRHVRLVARLATTGNAQVPMWGNDGWIRIEAATPSDPRWAIYRAPAAGGAFEREFASPFDGGCNCSMSVDGRRWVGVRDGTRSDIVLVRDFDQVR